MGLRCFKLSERQHPGKGTRQDPGKRTAERRIRPLRLLRREGLQKFLPQAVSRTSPDLPFLRAEALYGFFSLLIKMFEHCPAHRHYFSCLCEKVPCF